MYVEYHLLGYNADPEDGGDVPPKRRWTQRTIWRYIPEDGTLHNHRCENLKSYKNVCNPDVFFG
jgi:hypothetical protein